MNIEVVPCPEEQKQVLKNLYSFWRYNRLQYLESGAGSYINDYGVIDGDTARTHEEATRGEDYLWTKPGVICPFLIRADGRLVGFAVVCGHGHCTRGRDWRMNDFLLPTVTGGRASGGRRPARFLTGFAANGRSDNSPGTRPARPFGSASLATTRAAPSSKC